MDISTLFDQYMVIPILVICFCVGYIIKNTPALEPIANNYIPIICGILGVILGIWMGGFTIQAIAEGLVSGLAATGIHQSVCQVIEHKAIKEAKLDDIRDDIEVKAGDVNDDEE